MRREAAAQSACAVHTPVDSRSTSSTWFAIGGALHFLRRRRNRPRGPIDSRMPARFERTEAAWHLLSLRRSMRRAWWWVLGAFALLVVLVVVGSRFVDEPLRRRVESDMNASLKGY